LDTNKAEGARLHKEATEAFEKAKKKRAKRGVKGGGKDDEESS